MPRDHSSYAALAAALFMALVLAACGGSDGGTSVAQRTGAITLGLTDAPVDDAAEVVVVFTGIELQRVGGERVTLMLPASRSIDLLQLSDGRTTNLVENLQVEAGEYEWMRLMITAEQNLQSGSYIKLKDGRRIQFGACPGGATTDLRRSKSTMSRVMLPSATVKRRCSLRPVSEPLGM